MQVRPDKSLTPAWYMWYLSQLLKVFLTMHRFSVQLLSPYHLNGCDIQCAHASQLA